MQKQSPVKPVGKLLRSAPTDKGGAVFYVVGIMALVMFFSPFVLIYHMVKTARRCAPDSKHRAHKAEMVYGLDRSAEDASGFLYT